MPYLTPKAQDIDWKFTDKELQKKKKNLVPSMQVSEPRIKPELADFQGSALCYFLLYKEPC